VAALSDPAEQRAEAAGRRIERVGGLGLGVLVTRKGVAPAFLQLTGGEQNSSWMLSGSRNASTEPHERSTMAE
jgi:hypothetical protein